MKRHSLHLKLKQSCRHLGAKCRWIIHKGGRRYIGTVWQPLDYVKSKKIPVRKDFSHGDITFPKLFLACLKKILEKLYLG